MSKSQTPMQKPNEQELDKTQTQSIKGDYRFFFTLCQIPTIYKNHSDPMKPKFKTWVAKDHPQKFNPYRKPRKWWWINKNWRKNKDFKKQRWTKITKDKKKWQSPLHMPTVSYAYTNSYSRGRSLLSYFLRASPTMYLYFQFQIDIFSIFRYDFAHIFTIQLQQTISIFNSKLLFILLIFIFQFLRIRYMIYFCNYLNINKKYIK